MQTQNVEELSLDLIFHNNFWQNFKSFSKQNCKLRIHSKLSVCAVAHLGISVLNHKDILKLVIKTFDGNTLIRVFRILKNVNSKGKYIEHKYFVDDK